MHQKQVFSGAVLLTRTSQEAAKLGILSASTEKNLLPSRQERTGLRLKAVNLRVETKKKVSGANTIPVSRSRICRI